MDMCIQYMYKIMGTSFSIILNNLTFCSSHNKHQSSHEGENVTTSCNQTLISLTNLNNIYNYRREYYIHTIHNRKFLYTSSSIDINL